MMTRYKKGDWVVTYPVPLPNPGDNGDKACIGGSGYQPDKLVQISLVDNYDNEPGHDPYQIIWAAGYLIAGVYANSIRPATPEEIRTGKVIKSNIYELWV